MNIHEGHYSHAYANVFHYEYEYVVYDYGLMLIVDRSYTRS